MAMLDRKDLIRAIRRAVVSWQKEHLDIGIDPERPVLSRPDGTVCLVTGSPARVNGKKRASVKPLNKAQQTAIMSFVKRLVARFMLTLLEVKEKATCVICTLRLPETPVSIY